MTRPTVWVGRYGKPYDSMRHDAKRLEVVPAPELEQLQTRLECIQTGRRYPDCTGDCGENSMYCCDGAWDFYNRMAKAEAKLEIPADALEMVAAQRDRYRAAIEDHKRLRGSFAVWKGDRELWGVLNALGDGAA